MFHTINAKCASRKGNQHVLGTIGQSIYSEDDEYEDDDDNEDDEYEDDEDDEEKEEEDDEDDNKFFMMIEFFDVVCS